MKASLYTKRQVIGRS